MTNLFNDDFQDFIKALNTAEVRYMLVGGYSVILHGYVRTTGDMDIWVDKSLENYHRLEKAFQVFGMPVFDMIEDNFLHHPTINVFTYGKKPYSIDIITNLLGLSFNDGFSRAQIMDLEGLAVRVIHYNDLITVKTAAGRPRDINDIEQLKAYKNQL